MYNKINELCKQNGTNISNLCETVTGSRGNLSTWKKGYMRSDYLLKVAQYFNVSVDYLLGYNPDKQSDGKTEKLLAFASKLTEDQIDALIEMSSKFLDT